MVVKSLCAATLLAAASTAYAGQFETIGIDLGAALGSLGTPIPVTGGTLVAFAGGGGSSDAFIHNLLAASPGSGIGMVAVSGVGPGPGLVVGPAAAGTFAPWSGVENILDSATFPTANPAQLQGVWLDNQIQLSGSHPTSGRDAAFYGQFGVTGTGGGFDLSNVDAKVTIREEGDANEQTVTATNAPGGGPDSNNGFGYRLTMVKVGFDAGTGSNVFQLWVEQVPTPGTLAIAGMGGLAFLRRRRA